MFGVTHPYLLEFLVRPTIFPMQMIPKTILKPTPFFDLKQFCFLLKLLPHTRKEMSHYNFCLQDFIFKDVSYPPLALPISYSKASPLSPKFALTMRHKTLISRAKTS